MIESVQVIGSGRVGSAVGARLRERGIAVDGDDAELVVLCVPDRCDRGGGAGDLSPGPWICHVSGATPLAALDAARAALLASIRCRRSSSGAARSSSTARAAP